MSEKEVLHLVVLPFFTLDAMVIVANEIVALGEAVDSEEGASEAQKRNTSP